MTPAERKKKLELVRNENAYDVDWWTKHSSHGPTDYVRHITFLLSEIDKRDVALRLSWNHRNSIFKAEPAAKLVIAEIGEALGESEK